MLQRQMGDGFGKPYKIVLTGATGFIGRHLQNTLVGRGYRCTAYIRPQTKYADSIVAGVEIVKGELTDHNALKAVLSDADFVVYCAGSVRGITQDDFRAANVDGLRNVVWSLNNT